jgi:hypothetical protein
MNLIRVPGAVLSLFLAVASGCKSYEEIAAERHDRLVQIYPLGTTTREDVAKKWGATKPELAFDRPAAGWLALPRHDIAVHPDTVEKKTQREIASFERYFGVDGFLSLCRCWFYYDREGKLVEVEWQYVSD